MIYKLRTYYVVDAADRAKVAWAELASALTPDTIKRLNNVRGKTKAWENVKSVASRASRPNDSRGTFFLLYK